MPHPTEALRSKAAAFRPLRVLWHVKHRQDVLSHLVLDIACWHLAAGEGATEETTALTACIRSGQDVNGSLVSAFRSLLMPCCTC